MGKLIKMRFQSKPSSNEEDTIGACWHGNINLEAVLRWRTSTYLCTLLGCSRDVLQINIGNKDSDDVNVEPKGDASLNMHEDVFVIA
jgi:hypothetical protein